MASVYMHTTGTYYAKYVSAGGKRVSKNTGASSKREALRLANGFEADERDIQRKQGNLPKEFAARVEAAAREAAAGELTLARADDLIQQLHRLANPNFKVVSLDQHLADWIAIQGAHVSPKTVALYADTRRRFTAAAGKKIAAAPVGDLTPDQVRKVLGKINEGVRSSTANLDLRALRRALHAAVTAGLAKANAAQDVRPFKETDSTQRVPFTADEVRAMIDHPSTGDEWRGCILIAAHTGLRLGDVVKLNRSNVDGDRLVVKTGKTGKSLSIPITPPVMGWIGDRQGQLFPHHSKVVRGTLSTTFTRIMERASVARDVPLPGGGLGRRSFHSLRHTFASWLAEADVHADVRQKLTGHSSSRIHAKYSHHDEALDRAVASLPAL
jgi:integrase